MERTEPIKIVGGRSFFDSITLQTADFATTASLEKGGGVRIVTKPTPKLARTLIALRHPLMPKTLRTVALLLVGLDRWSAALLGLTVLINAAVPMLLGPATHAPTSAWTGHALDAILAVCVVWMAWLIRTGIGPWHAAEHMVIAAYQRTGRYDRETIMQENRVDPHCGGRFALPLLLAGWTAAFLEIRAGIWFWPAYLLLIEAILRIDEYRSWHRIPVFAQASTLLQRHVTTMPPQEVHIIVAQAALAELIRAHATAAEEPSVALAT